MNVIAMCFCGCETVIFREGSDLFIQSAVIGQDNNGPISEKIEYIDSMGFINGKHSFPKENLEAVLLELNFI